MDAFDWNLRESRTGPKGGYGDECGLEQGIMSQVFAHPQFGKMFGQLACSSFYAGEERRPKWLMSVKLRSHLGYVLWVKPFVCAGFAAAGVIIEPLLSARCWWLSSWCLAGSWEVQVFWKCLKWLWLSHVTWVHTSNEMISYHVVHSCHILQSCLMTVGLKLLRLIWGAWCQGGCGIPNPCQ